MFKWGIGTYKSKYEFSFLLRLLIPITGLFFITITVIGVLSYTKARDSQMALVNERLDREVYIMRETARNLKYAFIRDEEEFQRQLISAAEGQRIKLMQDNYSPRIFLFHENKQVEFVNRASRVIEMDEKIVSRIKKDQHNSFVDSWNGEKWLFQFGTIQELQGIYVIAIPNENIMRAANELASYFLSTGIISLIIIVCIVIFIIRRMTSPLTKLRNEMKKAREGNFDQTASVISHIPEVRSLNKSYQMLIETISTMLKNINQAINQITYTSDELSASSEQLSSHQLRMKNNLLKVVDGTEQIQHNFSQYEEIFLKLKRLMELLNSEFRQMSEKQNKMNESVKRGTSDVLSIVMSLDQAYDGIRVMSDKINEFKSQSEEIMNAGAMIQELAERTKLLSLNATIEAVRAGENGKGFAVVAEEVRKLADSSKKTAVDIDSKLQATVQIGNFFAEQFVELSHELSIQLHNAQNSSKTFTLLSDEIKVVADQINRSQQEVGKTEAILPELEDAFVGFQQHIQQTLTHVDELLGSAALQQQAMEETEEIRIQLVALGQSLASLIKNH